MRTGWTSLWRTYYYSSLKAVERMEAVFAAQIITYLKLSGLWLGLLMNFNVPVLRDGIKRVVQD